MICFDSCAVLKTNISLPIVVRPIIEANANCGTSKALPHIFAKAGDIQRCYQDGHTATAMNRAKSLARAFANTAQIPRDTVPAICAKLDIVELREAFLDALHAVAKERETTMWDVQIRAERKAILDIFQKAWPEYIALVYL